MEDLEKRHKAIALPCVRVRAGQAGGSGTIIYNAPSEDRGYSIYALTNYHVIEGCIKIENKWSSLLKKYKKVDSFEAVECHLFNYRWGQRAVGGSIIQADIMAYDQEEDLALLKLRGEEKAPSVATLYPRNKERELYVGERVICVGAGLGEKPVQTEGILSQFGIEISRREFWLSSAASIFGNSGGALFLKRSYELIGVPARIAVSMAGFSMDPITHLSYAIPVTRIYDFLDEQKFRFVYDADYTEKGEAELREKLRTEEEEKQK